MERYFTSFESKSKSLEPPYSCIFFSMIRLFLEKGIRAHPHTHVKAFRNVINCTCKSNFWLQVFTAQLPVFGQDICLPSCNCYTDRCHWLLNEGIIISVLILKAIDSTRISKRFPSQSSLQICLYKYASFACRALDWRKSAACKLGQHFSKQTCLSSYFDLPPPSSKRGFDLSKIDGNGGGGVRQNREFV